MKRLSHKFDFCVVGGGIAGIVAAIAAARNGAKVALVQDRPMFGGNSSSEIRVHVCGADVHNQKPNLRETGILEEIRMDNLRTNALKNFSIWDTVLYEKVRFQPNLTYFLNCSICDAEMDGNRIKSVTGWQLTTYTWHTIEADIFADCSGDGILAPLTGAKYRIGREARSEFNESIQPEVADKKTMGMTCLFQARDMGVPIPFEPPSWAYDYPSDEDLPNRWHGWITMGYWWVELGGEQDSIHDTEEIRDELLKIVYGIWDHIKNHGEHGYGEGGSQNWALEWIQFLPGKRESVRYIGDHIVTQNDVESEGRFDDLVAYGGWPMDDHDTAGFRHPGHPTIFYPTPSPYGIPYRALYSANIENLMFAGRCASFTHAGMSSARVMGTGASEGQAVGTAVGIAIREGITPREVGQKHLEELQQSLLWQDAYLPWIPMKFSELTTSANLTATSGDPEPLRDGFSRPIGEDTHAWNGTLSDTIEYTWTGKKPVKRLTIITDSALDKDVALSYHGWNTALTHPPLEMLKDFRVEVKKDGEWVAFTSVEGNYQRLVRVEIGEDVEGVRVVPVALWGEVDDVRLFAFYLE